MAGCAVCMAGLVGAGFVGWLGRACRAWAFSQKSSAHAIEPHRCLSPVSPNISSTLDLTSLSAGPQVKCPVMAEKLQVSKKRKFVREGLFRAELNEFLMRELAEDGYSGLEIRVAPNRTEIIIMATRTQNVLGDKGRRIRELTAVVTKRFGFAPGSIELYAEKVGVRGLCAIAQAESLRYKLVGGLAVRRACYGVLRFIMESGAKGCEVVVSGKLRGQRAKSMKFVDGLMIHSGDPTNHYVDAATRHVLLRQGVLGIKVKIMLPWDPNGKMGPKKPLPDHVGVVEPKEDTPRDKDNLLAPSASSLGVIPAGLEGLSDGPAVGKVY